MASMLFRNKQIHPVSITRFPSFRTQPLESLSVDSVKNGFLSNPAPGENLERESCYGDRVYGLPLLHVSKLFIKLLVLFISYSVL